MSVASPHPGQGLLADVPLGLFRESRRLYLPMPAGTAKAVVSVVPEEPAGATPILATEPASGLAKAP